MSSYWKVLAAMVRSVILETRRYAVVKVAVRTCCIAFSCAFLPTVTFAQTTSWTGATSTNWNDANWTSGVPTTGSTVQFDANSTLNLSTNNNISNLSLTGINDAAGAAGPVSITGNMLTLGSGGINMTGATQDLTVGADLALSASQTWTQINGRILTLNGGNLYLSNTASAQTLTLSLASGGGTTEIDDTIANSSAGGASPSSITVVSTGTSNAGATLVLKGNNTFSGGITLNSRAAIYQIGASTVGSPGSVVSGPFGTGTVSFINANTVPNLQALGGDQTLANAINMSGGGFNFSGSHNLTLTGPITVPVSRAITYNSGSGDNLTFNGDLTMGTTGSGGGTLTTSITANTTAATGKLIFNGRILEAPGVTSGAILLLSNGSNGTTMGAVAFSDDQLNAQNTYSGGTNLNGQGSTVEVGCSSILSGSTIVSGPLGTGTLKFNNTNSAPRIQAVNGAQTVANAIDLTSNGNVIGTNDLTLTGVISNTGQLRMNGTGKLTLTADNTYTGTTTINSGTLSIPSIVDNNPGQPQPLGQSPNAIVVGSSTAGTFEYTGSAATTFARPVTIGGTGGGVIRATSATGTGLTLAGNGGDSVTIGANSVTFDGAGNITVSSTISGTRTAGTALTKTGTGTLASTGLNTYTGNTKVLGGTMTIANPELDDNADLYLMTGTTFGLNFANPGDQDTIRSLYIDNVLQPTGTWGAIGSGAAHTSSLLSGIGWLNVLSNVPPPLPGDFNSDGKVDAADYNVWRKNQVANVALPNDTGLTTQADRFNLWRANFGNSIPAGSGSGLSASGVPEPTAIVLAGFAIGGFVSIMRRRDRNRV